MLLTWSSIRESSIRAGLTSVLDQAEFYVGLDHLMMVAQY